MKYLPIVASLAIIGVLFLILNGIVSTYNYKKRAVIMLIFGLVLTLIFTSVYIIDLKLQENINVDYITPNKLTYFSLIGVSLLYTIILFIHFYKKGKYLRQNFSGRVKTILDKKEYLYLLYRYQDNLYLEKEKHSGFIYKLGSKDFHDDVILKVASKFKTVVKADNMERIGTYTIKGEKDNVYYCYLITCDEKVDSKDYLAFDRRKVINLDFSNLDRQIIFRMLLREGFDVVVEENK